MERSWGWIATVNTSGECYPIGWERQTSEFSQNSEVLSTLVKLRGGLGAIGHTEF